MLPAHVAAEINRRRQRHEDARVPLHIEDVSGPEWKAPDWMKQDQASGEDADASGRVFREPDWATNY